MIAPVITDAVATVLVAGLAVVYRLMNMVWFFVCTFVLAVTAYAVFLGAFALLIIFLGVVAPHVMCAETTSKSVLPVQGRTVY